MTIKTLTYIHNLLIEDESKKALARKLVRESLNDALDNNAPNTAELQDLYDKSLKSHMEAQNALQEFEEKEW